MAGHLGLRSPFHFSFYGVRDQILPCSGSGSYWAQKSAGFGSATLLKMQGFGSEFRSGSGRICNHLGLWIRIQIQGYPSNNKWVSLCVLYSYIQACIKFQDFWFSSSHHEIFFSFSSTFCNMGLWIKIWGKQFLLYTFINVCLRCMCSAGLKTVNIWFLLLTTYYNVVL